MSKQPWYVTSHPGHLSLAIPPWAGAVNTSKSTPRDAPAPYPWSRSVSRCLAEGYGNEDERCPVWAFGLGRTLRSTLGAHYEATTVKNLKAGRTGLPWGWHFNPHTHPIPTGIPI